MKTGTNDNNARNTVTSEVILTVSGRKYVFLFKFVKHLFSFLYKKLKHKKAYSKVGRPLRNVTQQIRILSAGQKQAKLGPGIHK